MSMYCHECGKTIEEDTDTLCFDCERKQRESCERKRLQRLIDYESFFGEYKPFLEW